MLKLLIIDREAVRSVLRMAECIDAMQAAAVAVTNGTINVPLRRSTALHSGAGALMIMTGSSTMLPAYGAKLISLHPGNPRNDLPVIQGFVSLFDNETGIPIAIIEGSSLTAMRTAAASGMATRLLARSDARTHGIMGAGVQAETHAQAIMTARTSIQETLIWARDYLKAQQLAQRLAAKWGARVQAVPYAEDAAACDVVTTVTAAVSPVLLGQWLRAGAHLNLIGAHAPTAREADTEAILRSRVYVETVDAAMSEAGDLIIPESEGVFSRADIVGTIGGVASGHITGRRDANDITLYKSLGNAAQDIYAAWVVYMQAKEKGLGTSVLL